MHDLVIRGTLNFDDIAVRDERIVEIGPELAAGKTEIDGRGLTAFPGLVDVHVHFNEPGRTEWEGAATGSRAFAAGGGTCFVDMPLNSSPCTVNGEAFDAKLAALKAASVTDFALWGGLIPGNLREMEELAERGVVGFKAFMCNSGLPEFPRADDLTLFKGMKEAARLGLPVAVHAENEEMTSGFNTHGTDIKAFLESRPVIAEVEAITRAGLLAREAGCRLHVVHISSGSGVAAALAARAAGTDISIETCPHYLFFTEDDLYRIGALAKCAPPLRTAAERPDIRDIDIIGSDHSPCPPEMKRRENFFEIWGGIAGVQTTLPVMIGLSLSPDRIAALTATNGARRFGLVDKGAIAVGFHADIALVDLNGTFDMTLLHRHGVSPYTGSVFQGAVEYTILRGKPVTPQTRGQHAKSRLHAN